MHLLNPLLKSSIDTVLLRGPKEGLTGPVKRGDRKTILSHLEYLKSNHPELIPSYKILTSQLIPITGLSSPEQEDLQKLLDDF